MIKLKLNFLLQSNCRESLFLVCLVMVILLKSISMKTRIPPPLVTLIFGFIIFLTKNIFPKIKISNNIAFGSLFILIGILIASSSIILFKRYRTAITPINPKSATKLITGGIYKFSRNPMYFSLLLLLIGISIMTNPIGGFIFIPIFILYLNLFQILPEEKAMTDLFKDEFLEYKNSVRRWI